MNPTTPKKLRSGYLLTDVLMGLAIVAMLTVLLASAMGRSKKAATKLADNRAAIRLAERALLSTRAGIDINDPKVEVRPIEGGNWITARATVNGQTVELIGLMPGGTR